MIDAAYESRMVTTPLENKMEEQATDQTEATDEATEEPLPTEAPKPPTPATRRPELTKHATKAHERMALVWTKADATKKVSPAMEIRPEKTVDDGLKISYVFRVGGVEQTDGRKVCELLTEIHTTAAASLKDAPSVIEYQPVSGRPGYFRCTMEWWAD